MAREIPYVQAVNEALHTAMASDPDVIIMGEDIAGGGGREDQGIEEAWGGIMGATKGLYKEFGGVRVRDDGNDGQSEECTSHDDLLSLTDPSRGSSQRATPQTRRRLA